MDHTYSSEISEREEELRTEDLTERHAAIRRRPPGLDNPLDTCDTL